MKLWYRGIKARSFLAGNQPDTTKQVFEAIRQAKPPRLYVAADGPRADKAEKQIKTWSVPLFLDGVQGKSLEWGIKGYFDEA